MILSFIFFFFLPLGLWDLSSLTRGQTLAPCNRSTKSKPLDHQGSPSKGDVEYTEGYSNLKLCRNIKPINVDLEVYQQIGGHLSHEDSPTTKEWSEKQTKGRSLRNITGQKMDKGRETAKGGRNEKPEKQEKDGELECKRVGKGRVQGGSGQICLVQVGGQGKEIETESFLWVLQKGWWWWFILAISEEC